MQNSGIPGLAVPKNKSIRTRILKPCAGAGSRPDRPQKQVDPHEDTETPGADHVPTTLPPQKQVDPHEDTETVRGSARRAPDAAPKNKSIRTRILKHLPIDDFPATFDRPQKQVDPHEDTETVHGFNFA